MNLPKKVLFKKIADKAEVSLTATEKIMETAFQVIKEELKAGNSIEIREFGTFKVKHCAAKVGRNIRTGQPVPVPEKDKMTFRFSKRA